MHKHLHGSKITRTFVPSLRKKGSLTAQKFYRIERPNQRKDNQHSPMNKKRCVNLIYKFFNSMSYYSLEIPFRDFRGRICRHSEIIYKAVHGTRYTSVLCNPYKGEPTAAQLAQRNKMREAIANIQNLSATELAAYQASFKAQTRYRTLRGYMIAQEMLKLS